MMLKVIDRIFEHRILGECKVGSSLGVPYCYELAMNFMVRKLRKCDNVVNVVCELIYSM